MIEVALDPLGPILGAGQVHGRGLGKLQLGALPFVVHSHHRHLSLQRIAWPANIVAAQPRRVNPIHPCTIGLGVRRNDRAVLGKSLAQRRRRLLAALLADLDHLSQRRARTSRMRCGFKWTGALSWMYWRMAYSCEAVRTRLSPTLRPPDASTSAAPPTNAEAVRRLNHLNMLAHHKCFEAKSIGTTNERHQYHWEAQGVSRNRQCA